MNFLRQIFNQQQQQILSNNKALHNENVHESETDDWVEISMLQKLADDFEQIEYESAAAENQKSISEKERTKRRNEIICKLLKSHIQNLQNSKPLVLPTGRKSHPILNQMLVDEREMMLMKRTLPKQDEANGNLKKKYRNINLAAKIVPQLKQPAAAEFMK